MNNQERQNPFDPHYRGDYSSSPESDDEEDLLVTEEISLTDEEAEAQTRQEMQALINQLGIVESPAMQQARVDMEKADTITALDELVLLYRDLAGDVNIKVNTVEGAKEQVAVYLQLALIYHQHEFWMEADDLLVDVLDYADQMKARYGDSFGDIADQIAQL